MATHRHPILRAPKVLFAAVAAFALLVGAAPVSRSAPATAPSCGGTLTASVRLQSDLVGCTSIGLVVGAAGITVDLNGHKLGGTNVSDSVGILNNGHANVNIVNGTISGFHNDGVAIHNAHGNTVSRLTIRGIGSGGKQNDADAGVLVDHSPAAVVSDTVVIDNVHAFQADGVDVLFSPGTQILRDSLNRNQWNGLVVIKSPQSRVIDNQLDSNGNNGMEANGASDSILVSGNHADRNTSAGLVVGALAHARVKGNSVSDNGQDGLFFFDLAASTIQGNHATANAIGIDLHGGRHGSKLNQLTGNAVTANTRVGIWVHGDNANGPVDDNLVSANTAAGNGPDGGVFVDGAAHRNTLRANTATGNAGHGISAVSGTIDGGRNRAHGNRAAPQCVGVACA